MRNKFKKFLDSGQIFEIDGIWYRKCPKCGTNCSTRRNWPSALIQMLDRPCDSCRASNTGKINSIGMIGENNHFFGKSHSKKVIEQIRLKQIGKKATWKTRCKMSASRSGLKNPMFGKKMSEEVRRKIREGKLRWLERTGIPSNVDEGAPEWFKKYNLENGLNLKPKRFFEIGYDADGYDEEKHIWIEYDTKYHNTPRQRNRDSVRDNNIIKYFESIGKPLKEYKRYYTWNDTINKILCH